MCLPGISDDDPTYGRIFPNSTGPAREDVVGAVSCIVWSLTLIPLIKYCWIVLRAGDDQGEGTTCPLSCLTVGGTFVLYMLMSRYLNLDRHTPGHNIQQSDSLLLTVTETLDSTSDFTGRPIKGAWIRENKLFRVCLLLWALFGASCVMADGLLTPAVSVISAVAGIVALLGG
jgi:KUP system potassium uptake protein